MVLPVFLSGRAFPQRADDNGGKVVQGSVAAVSSRVATAVVVVVGRDLPVRRGPILSLAEMDLKGEGEINCKYLERNAVLLFCFDRGVNCRQSEWYLLLLAKVAKSCVLKKLALKLGSICLYVSYT
jgi:hypothetical protein